MDKHTDYKAALERPFDASEVDWKPQAYTKEKDRALAVAYVDARAVGSRLDEVFGYTWSDHYEVIENTDSRLVVECIITVQLEDGNTIQRRDVGEETADNLGEVSRYKSAYSDAFKRAGVKFGIGRYLYALGGTWEEVGKYGFSDASKEKLAAIYRKHVGGSKTAEKVAEKPAQKPAEKVAGPSTKNEVMRAALERIGLDGAEPWKSSVRKALLRILLGREVAGSSELSEVEAGRFDVMSGALAKAGWKDGRQEDWEEGLEYMRAFASGYPKADARDIPRLVSEDMVAFGEARTAEPAESSD